jgi:hypothetical protein
MNCPAVPYPEALNCPAVPYPEAMNCPAVPLQCRCVIPTAIFNVPSIHPHNSRSKTSELLYLAILHQNILRKCHVTFKSGIFTVTVYFLTCLTLTTDPKHALCTAAIFFAQWQLRVRARVCVCVFRRVVTWRMTSSASFCLVKGGGVGRIHLSQRWHVASDCPDTWATF